MMLCFAGNFVVQFVRNISHTIQADVDDFTYFDVGNGCSLWQPLALAGGQGYLQVVDNLVIEGSTAATGHKEQAGEKGEKVGKFQAKWI